MTQNVKQAPESPPKVSNISGGDAPKYLVIIDDDTDIVFGIGRYFRSCGFRTRGFLSADEFMDSLDWTPTIDCIISDVRMPGVDGIELLRRLPHHNISAPVILITGHGDIPTAVSGVKAGAFDFIEKPIDPAALETAVRNAITSNSTTRTSKQRSIEWVNLYHSLTDRQKTVFALVAEGLTSKEIAMRLKMSHRTVETHRATIMQKLRVDSLADMIRIQILLLDSPTDSL